MEAPDDSSTGQAYKRNSCSFSAEHETTVTLAVRLLETCTALKDQYSALNALLAKHDAPFFLDKWIRHLGKESNFTTLRLNEAQSLPDLGSPEPPSAEDEQREKKIRLQLSASNIPGYATQWDLLKKCHALAGFHVTMQMVPPEATGADGAKPPGPAANGYYPKRDKRHANDVFVDAVVEDGAEWLRVIGTTETRLVYEMTAAGWDFGGVESDDDDSGSDEDEEMAEDIAVLQAARDLILAARANRHEYRFPRLRIVLPRVSSGSNPDIDVLLARIRKMGTPWKIQLMVETADSPFVTSAPPALDVALSNLLPRTYRDLTPTLNLDCSVLIALASDITHSKTSVDPARHRTQNAEIEKENKDPGLFLRIMYPALSGRRLVCTREAAVTLKKLIGLMATPTEAARASLLLPEDGQEDEAGLLASYRAMSIHPVPEDLQLPVHVVDGEWNEATIQAAIQEGQLPRVAGAVRPWLTDPSLSVFTYGWASGLTTITSNRVASNAIRRLVERNRFDDDEKGPAIWVCGIARSLKCTPKDHSRSQTRA